MLGDDGSTVSAVALGHNTDGILLTASEERGTASTLAALVTRDLSRGPQMPGPCGSFWGFGGPGHVVLYPLRQLHPDRLPLESLPVTSEAFLGESTKTHVEACGSQVCFTHRFSLPDKCLPSPSHLLPCCRHTRFPLGA